MKNLQSMLDSDILLYGQAVTIDGEYADVTKVRKTNAGGWAYCKDWSKSESNDNPVLYFGRTSVNIFR